MGVWDDVISQPRPDLPNTPLVTVNFSFRNRSRSPTTMIDLLVVFNKTKLRPESFINFEKSIFWTSNDRKLAMSAFKEAGTSLLSYRRTSCPTTMLEISSTSSNRSQYFLKKIKKIIIKSFDFF